MNKTQKTLMIAVWSLCVIGMVAVVASGVLHRHNESAEQVRVVDEPRQLEPLFPTPDFHLTNQDGQPFSAADLKGQVWVADFVFTRCAGPCPMMTEKMANLQKAVGPANVKLVTFTVDPEHDTPAVLKEYAEKYKADPKQWTLATGKMDEIFAVSQRMKLAVGKAEDNAIIHSSRFVLVDREGMIRGYYSGEDKDGATRLTADALTLAGRK